MTGTDIFFTLYWRFPSPLYVSYMEKAHLLAEWLEVEAEQVNRFNAGDRLQHLIMHGLIPEKHAPDVCFRCNFLFSYTLGGRVRNGCPKCSHIPVNKPGVPFRWIDNYTLSNLSKMTGYCMGQTEILLAEAGARCWIWNHCGKLSADFIKDNLNAPKP